MDVPINVLGAKVSQGSCFVVLSCSCGAEILLVPDIAAMSAAIEAHVVEHQRKFGLSDEEAERVRDLLIIQTFKLAAKQQCEHR
jgi:hypothetical protein